MNIVTVATKDLFYLKWLKMSCLRNNTDLTVVGMNSEWNGYITKINLFYEYLNTRDDNEIICFVDAYDVIMLKDNSHLIYEFDLFEKQNPNCICISQEIKVMFKSFYVPYFEEFIKDRFLSDSYSKTMNSGGIIGRVSILKEIWKSIITISNRDDDNDDESCIVKYNKENPGIFVVDSKRIFFDTIFDPFFDEPYYPTDAIFIHKVGNSRMINLLKKYNYEVTNDDIIKLIEDELNITFLSKMYYHIKSFNFNDIITKFINSKSIEEFNPDFLGFCALRQLYNTSETLKNRTISLLTNLHRHGFKLIDNAKFNTNSINSEIQKNKKGTIILTSHYFISLDFCAIHNFFKSHIVMFAQESINTFEENMQNGIIPYYAKTEQYGYMVKKGIEKVINDGKNVIISATGVKDKPGKKITPKNGLLKLAYENNINICTVNVVDDSPSSFFEDILFMISQMTSRELTVITNDLIEPDLYPSFEIFKEAVTISLNKNIMRMRQLPI